MYARVETEVSHGHLLSMVGRLQEECCLMGGWAVFYLVNDRFRKDRMRDYIGSRDIDIGVPDIDALEALDRLLVDMRFEHLSFRYVKYLNYDSGEELDPERAKAIPLHMLIELFVDAMIPFHMDKAGEVFGFEPPDEPVLSRVFAEAGNHTTVRIAGRDIMVPAPEMMLAMKLNSIGSRNKDHKRIKDLCDIAALVLFSGKDRDELITKGRAEADSDKLRAVRPALNDDDYAQASGFLGISENAIRSIIERLLAAGSARVPMKR